VNAPTNVLQPSAGAASRPLRVLHVIDSLGMGGAETWLIELMRRWQARGGSVRADVLATGGLPSVFDEEARALGASVHYLRFGRRDLPAFAAGFRAILSEGEYDALHDHQDYASGWHFLLGRGLLPPVRVTHVHNPAYQIRNNYGVTLGRRLAAQAGKRLVARYASHIAGTSLEALRGYGFDDASFAAIPKVVAHCGIDPARFAADPATRASVRAEFGWSDAVPVVLFAGRFDVSPDLGHLQNHKNSGFATDVAIATAQRSGAAFVFAGQPSGATAVLRARIQAAGLDKRIVFAGVRRDIGRLMGAADALLFPSRAEGLGMVAVEAQAAGLPVLASTSTPRECVVIPELVRFLDIEAGVAAWSDALLAALDAPRIDRLAANACVAASAFSIERSSAGLERLYRDGLPA
jgi:glycosyltransferase involved in cell wall biosynthesis